MVRWEHHDNVPGGQGLMFFTDCKRRRVRLVGVRKRISPKWLFL